MRSLYKFILLYGVAAISVIVVMIRVDEFANESIKNQENMLLKQAQVHYQSQVNTRKWNASFGGVYVKPINGIKPNPYLKDNTLKVDENLTLIKINPAWMTRQLSETADIKDFHFKIVSLIPINPNNRVTSFEKRALEHIERTNDREYYELDDKFNYVGALTTRESCLPCHKHQGYKLGDIRGGISITLDATSYKETALSVENNSLITKVTLILFIFVIVLLIHKQIQSTKNLLKTVEVRTREINRTKTILQNVIDADLSFLLVSDGTDIILVNKTVLTYFGYSSLEEFQREYSHISDAFVEEAGSDLYLQRYIDGEHWIDYLQREQKNKSLKAKIKNSQGVRTFKPHATEIIVDTKKLHIIVFDDITDELKTIEGLTKKVMRDPLTGLYNRRKFNEILTKEIELSLTTYISLSMIFLDIDNFKEVNDTYGHDVGDDVLVALSEILLSTVRTVDFIARWGGEEFVITLQATSASQALSVAENLRKKVFEHDFGLAGKQSISLGITQYIEGETKADFTKRVDEALYEAKNSGKNIAIVK
jgi:diguanylate cyclase (GGDEF)-like protein